MFMDLFLAYSFVRRLATPFREWEAYRLGIIDAEGNQLKSRKSLATVRERDAFGVFDLMLLNIKRIIEKVPGGQTRLASYAAALYLIKERVKLNESTEMSDWEVEEKILREFFDGVLVPILDESEAAVMTAGSGQIAGIGVGPNGEPPAPTPAQRRKKRKKIKRGVL